MALAFPSLKAPLFGVIIGSGVENGDIVHTWISWELIIKFTLGKSGLYCHEQMCHGRHLRGVYWQNLIHYRMLMTVCIISSVKSCHI